MTRAAGPRKPRHGVRACRSSARLAEVEVRGSSCFLTAAAPGLRGALIRAREACRRLRESAPSERQRRRNWVAPELRPVHLEADMECHGAPPSAVGVDAKIVVRAETRDFAHTEASGERNGLAIDQQIGTEENENVRQVLCLPDIAL